MNGFTEVNEMTEKNQESQENTLRNEMQYTAEAGTPRMTIEREKNRGNKGCAGRSSEEIAVSRNVSGIAAMTGEWGE